MNESDFILLDSWRHGSISKQDFMALQSRLYEDPDLRAALRAFADLEEGLWGLAAQPPAEEPCRQRQFWKQAVPRLAAAAAMLIALGVGGWLIMSGMLSAKLNASPYDDREWPVHTVATWKNAPIVPTTVSVGQESTRMKSGSGAELQIDGPALFGVDSPSGGLLYGGSVCLRRTDSESGYSIQVSNLRLVDLGSEFCVTVIDDDVVEVEILEGEIEVQSLIRQPAFFWDFEHGYRDRVRGVGLEPGKRTHHVKGLVGKGALSFDNSSGAGAKIRGGTAAEVGAGSLAFSAGISIEALFVSNWSAKSKDYDEIFRKEDGRHRILLCFQNDGDKRDYDLPEVAPGPVLSFGIHLEGQGYSELDMPLDGREGRPSVAELTDGNIHHVVATYDSFTGEKILYIDGLRRFSHRFPIGSLILSGGPNEAQIGNYGRNEPFHGVIDEVALYTFALNAEEVSTHFDRVKRGMNYFGADAGPLDSAHWQSRGRYHGRQKLFFAPQTGSSIPPPH